MEDCIHEHVYYFKGSKDALCVKCNKYFLGQRFDISGYEKGKTGLWHKKKEQTVPQEST